MPSNGAEAMHQFSPPDTGVERRVSGSMVTSTSVRSVRVPANRPPAVPSSEICSVPPVARNSFWQPSEEVHMDPARTQVPQVW